MANNANFSFTPSKGVEWIFGSRPEDEKTREEFIDNFFGLDKLPKELQKKVVSKDEKKR